MTKKEYFKYFNTVYGILLEKFWNKKIKKRKIKKTTEWIIKNYLVSIGIFFFIAFYDTFLNLEWVTYLLVFSFLIILVANTIIMLDFIVKYQKNKKALSGEIKINKDNIIDLKEKGHSFSRTWDEIEFIISTKEAIFLFAKHKKFFIIPQKEKREEKVESIIKETSKELQIMKKEYQTGIKKWLIWGVYILLPIIAFLFFGCWYNYNISLMEEEIRKINEYEYQIDSHIYSYEKFGVIEQILKEYYDEFRKTREKYTNNSAEEIFSEITMDVLKNNPRQLQVMKESLEEREENATNAINHLLDLLTEEKVMKRITRKEWGETYENIFWTYAFTNYDSYYIESWQKELERNTTAMTYVKRAIEILTNEKKCWYIENDKLYMCDQYREEYNKLYQLILGDESKKI